MLIDPDKPNDEWEIEVKAANLDVAYGKCERLRPENYPVELLNVTQRTKTPDKNGNFKFVCWFRGES
ncbi:MAG: hypothetical protein HC860_15385 [Alkalinema sp. RU_4_3]|nr:hypothetical protein [Alkalinema sp. RU_4_3]